MFNMDDQLSKDTQSTDPTKRFLCNHQKQAFFFLASSLNAFGQPTSTNRTAIHSRMKPIWIEMQSNGTHIQLKGDDDTLAPVTVTSISSIHIVQQATMPHEETRPTVYTLFQISKTNLSSRLDSLVYWHFFLGKISLSIFGQHTSGIHLTGVRSHSVIERTITILPATHRRRQ